MVLDNYYLVQQAQQQIQQDLPVSYYGEWPTLDSGIFANYPQVYMMAHKIVSHTQPKLEVQRLFQFVESYQQITPLTMGEVWAFVQAAYR